MKELSAQQLRRTFDLQALGVESSGQLEPLEDIVGQQRAVAALRFGLGIHAQGFHIYVSGPPGIGKMTAVQSFLEVQARAQPAPSDWCYLHNFDDPYQPKACQLPAGCGRQLQQDVKALVEHVRRDLPKVFERAEYGTRRDDIVKSLNREREALFEQLTQQAAKAGFSLEMTPLGVAMFPLLGGRPLKEAEFHALPASVREDFERRRETLEDQMQSAMKQARELERASQQKLQALDEQVALYIVGELIKDLHEKYQALPDVLAYLNAVQKDMLENIELFKGSLEAKPAAGEGMPLTPWMRELPFRKYSVNVLVDNGKQQGTPVVVASNPTYNNLFGRVEKESQYGSLYTDFTMIKPGDLHRANGGYLVMRIEDLLKNALSWDGLKRALRSHVVEIEDVGERLGFLMTKGLKPQPIPLDVKVIVIGPPLLYYLLHSYDDEFQELFRVKADFDTRMDASAENIRSFLAFVATVCRKEQLQPFDRTGLARLLAHAARLAEDQQKLSTHFGALADVIREAHFWAQQDNASAIGEAHVRKALDQQVYRANLIEQRNQELIARGSLLIDTSGEAVGQVNGLSVLSLGDYWFGKPSRITASVAPGREGILDIEREVELGGPVHSKGVLILSGYLTQRFAEQRPLSLAARLVFEQSYEGVEGDSASGAELFALLSALAGAPLKQGIAVTGSVNQHGVVQAIGGVNEKIEGFFDVCRLKGLTGEQGVMIPQSNVQNLMLRDDVVAAVQAGQFHVWPIGTIDEGIEILTGIPAGQRTGGGEFDAGSVNALVTARLAQFAEVLKEFPEEPVLAPAEPSAGRRRDGKR